MKTMNDRIAARRKLEGLSQADLARRVGVSSVAVGKWESGLNQPKGRYLNELASALGVSIDWLLTGIDVIVADEAHRASPSTSQDFSEIIGGTKLIGLTATPAKSSHSNTEPATQDNHKVPVLSCAQAGVWTEPGDVSDFEGNIEYITTFEDVGAHTFAIWIKGRSMEPLFDEGDLVVCDPDIIAHPGDYVVAKNGNEDVIFKKYRPRGFNDDGLEYFELIPLNEDYAPIRSDMCPVTIIGVMVEHRKYRRRRRT